MRLFEDIEDISFTAMRDLEEYLASGEPLAYPPGQIFQGAIADVLTHVHVRRDRILLTRHGRPIGANQGVQLPIAKAHTAVESARLAASRGSLIRPSALDTRPPAVPRRGPWKPWWG